MAEDSTRQKQGPWIAWVTAIRWFPSFSTAPGSTTEGSSVLDQRYASSGTSEARDTLLIEAASEFAAFLSGRAYRLKHGPKPFVPEWSLSGDAPRAAALGLYGGVGSGAQKTLQVEWEEGWLEEHRRLRGK
jgi:hypothetical protein